MKKGKIFRALKSSITLLFVVALAGCGEGNTDADGGQSLAQADTTAEQRDYVYVAETEELASSYPIYGICSDGDMLYLTTYNEEENDTRGFAIDCLKRKSKPFRLPMEETAKSEVCQMTMDNDGNLVYTEKITESEDSVRFLLKTVSKEDWSLKTSVDITQAVGADRTWLGSLAIDKEGNVYVSGIKDIMVLSPEGKLLFEAHPNTQWLLGMSRTKDGRVAYMIPAADDTKGLTLSVLDTKEKGVVETYENIPGGNTEGMLALGTETDLLMDCNGAIYQYSLQDGSMQEELRWTDSMINGEDVRYFLTLSDGNMAAVLQSGINNPAQMVYLTKTSRSEVPQKEKVILAVGGSSQVLEEDVNYFNSHSEDYFVEIKDYGKGTANTIEAWEEIKTRMLLDILSDNAPDIIGTNYWDLPRLAVNGAIEDLTPFLESDPELKDVEFFAPILELGSVDGKIYTISSAFMLDTVVGREGEVEQISGITLEDFIRIAEQYSGELDFIDMRKEYLLEWLICSDLTRWINWETGQCNFDTEEFQAMLEFTRKYGQEPAEETEELMGPDKPSYLHTRPLGNGLDYKALDIIMGAKPVMIGYPVEEGSGKNGVLLRGFGNFMICANSNNKEGAWQFVRCFLTQEYYDATIKATPHYSFFPSRVDLYHQQMDAFMMTEVIIDENGVEQTVGKYEYNGEWGRFGREPMTEEDRETVTGLIENATGVNYMDMAIVTIIEEETAPYFIGQKSTDEVAKIIQSRVQLYVNENR